MKDYPLNFNLRIRLNYELYIKHYVLRRCIYFYKSKRNRKLLVEFINIILENMSEHINRN